MRHGKIFSVRVLHLSFYSEFNVTPRCSFVFMIGTFTDPPPIVSLSCLSFSCMR